MTTNGGGLGVVTVDIDKDISVSTWNNFVSDSAYGTLIDPDTEVFKSLSSFQIGQRVKFSGSFIAHQKLDCFQNQNLTMYGAMYQPVFTFRFSNVQVYQP